MAHRDDILRFAGEYLDVKRFQDHCVNGLQVEGRGEVKRIVTGVSCSLDLFARAAQEGAGMVIVHHGAFWLRQPVTVTGPLRGRLKVLLEHDINLAAYHLPLDAHPEVGNNAVLARALGLTDCEPFDKEDASRPIGLAGRLPEARDAATVHARLVELFGDSCRAFSYGPEKVERVAVISGGGAYALDEVIRRGIDMYVTGEAAEPTMALCREAGVHYVAGGHYSSERFGIRAFGEKVAEEFGIPVTFVDLPNPI